MQEQLQIFLDNIFGGLPTLIVAIIILIIGWIVAKGVRKLIEHIFNKTAIAKKIETGGEFSIGNFIGRIVYYIIMIMVLLIVLEKLGITQVLTPLENMLDKFMQMLPNIIAAGLVGFIGYFLANFVSNLINIGGKFLDKLVDKTGFKDTDKIINVLRKVVFIIIFIPILIQALDILQMESITAPANAVLSDFMAMIGQIIVAAIILLVFSYGGKLLSNFIKDLLTSMNSENLVEKIGLKSIIGEKNTLAGIISGLLYFFIVFFGVITAVEILDLVRLTDILNQLLEITAQILFGLVILVVGNYISKIIYDAMLRSDTNRAVANIVRFASLALFIAIALRTMGIANEIVELAFGLMMGAVAIAIALSYGLGGREAAGEHFKEIIKKLKSPKEDK